MKKLPICIEKFIFESYAFLIFKWYPNGTLLDVVRKGSLPFEKIQDYFKQLCEIILQIHENC